MTWRERWPVKGFVPALGAEAAGRWSGCRVTTPTFCGAGSGTRVGCILKGTLWWGQEDHLGDLGWPDRRC